MKKYDSYKDSGVEWIEEIPNHWDSGDMKYQLSNNDGGVWGSDVENEGEGTVVIRSTEITIDGKWDLSNPMKRLLNENEINKCKLYKDDIVLTKSSGSPDHIGKSVIVDDIVENLNCCYSNFVQRIRFRNYNPRLYHYIINSFIVREQYRYVTQSTTGLGNLNSTTLNQIQLPFIPLHEQQQIVKFLDNKTSLIDSLIEKTQQKIELLKEKRTSLINHVVTKGLNPNVEMKNSGVEWIGEIPREWSMISIKHLVSTKITDGPHETPTWVDEGIPFLSVESVQDNKLDFNKKRGYISPELHEIYSKKCKPQKDDIFIVKSGSTTGKSTIVETDEEFNIWSPLCIVRTNKNKISPRFIFSSIQSFYFRRFVELGWSFGTQPNIGMGVIENIRLVVPPISEQQQIVEYLDEQTLIIDTTITKEQKRVELLKEYRQSLISNVVTGKIKVTTDE
jgi:type I restriction enzyme, S subunit